MVPLASNERSDGLNHTWLWYHLLYLVQLYLLVFLSFMHFSIGLDLMKMLQAFHFHTEPNPIYTLMK